MGFQGLLLGLGEGESLPFGLEGLFEALGLSRRARDHRIPAGTRNAVQGLIPRQAKNRKFASWAETPPKKQLLQIECSKGNRHAFFDFLGKRKDDIGICLDRSKMVNFRLGPKNI